MPALFWEARKLELLREEADVSERRNIIVRKVSLATNLTPLLRRVVFIGEAPDILIDFELPSAPLTCSWQSLVA